jgi:hypothetical protein
MSPRFAAWKSHLLANPGGEADFQRWLFVRSAGVLFGGKGGELVVLKAGNCTLSVDQQIGCIRALSTLWRYSHVLLRRNGSGAKVVIYDPSEVQRTLSEVPRPFLNKMGYLSPVDPGAFLEEVARRWRWKEQMPHEIGLALGYPVKDVLGFIGLAPLQCTGLCGWRVYGDLEPSLRVRQRYRQAKAEARAFLDNGSEPKKAGHYAADNLRRHGKRNILPFPLHPEGLYALRSKNRVPVRD